MLQMSDNVGSFMNGSMVPVSGSGNTSMSLAWIGIHPRIEEPSNPSPSSKTASVSSAMGMVKCCQRSEEHTSELQSQSNLVCRLLLEKKKKKKQKQIPAANYRGSLMIATLTTLSPHCSSTGYNSYAH